MEGRSLRDTELKGCDEWQAANILAGCKCTGLFLKEARTLVQHLMSGGGRPVLAQKGRKNSHNSDLLARAV